MPKTYTKIYNEINKCDPYVNFLKNLKTTYDNFRSSVISADKTNTLDVVIQKVMSEININSSTNEFWDECVQPNQSGDTTSKLQTQVSTDQTLSQPVGTGTPPSMPGNGTDTLGSKMNIVDGSQYKVATKGVGKKIQEVTQEHPAKFYLDPSLSPASPEPSQPQPRQTQYSSQNTIPNGEPNLLQSHNSNPVTGIPLTPINFNTNPSSTDNRSINSRTDIKMSENHQYGV
ncbi:PIR protein CIR protein, fragment [Plasmodium vinckei]|uniref:PIR protein CIR protein n=1 Tax=Plasmodium vinckei TaxID=5860 RepID=A0A6V7SB56_PLAVN|nr:PIR protein CIR protein, fragment [Plasmodium vinckei]